MNFLEIVLLFCLYYYFNHIFDFHYLSALEFKICLIKLPGPSLPLFSLQIPYFSLLQRNFY